MSRGFNMRHAQMSRHSLFVRNTAPLSWGRIVPRVTIAEGNSIHPTLVKENAR